MSHRSRWTSVVAASAVSAVLVLSACTPGGGGDDESKDAKPDDISTDVASMGRATA